ncbi:nucleoside phosphorylase domain-containing protein [Xylogone sp. PMI_703]|nr:nucleoside phosphorylase domain-containing protein [Xylogone sp. PMI_703]
MARRRFTIEDYIVGWICALPIELAAATKMLDEKHPDPPQDTNDSNLYTLGRIGQHNVVIACFPAGLTGTNSAAAVAVQMKAKFTSIRFSLMVGIGGGVPSAEADIRLGDVVISQPHMGHGGVVQYDFGKTRPNGFQRTWFLNAPPTVLLNALTKLQANYLTNENSHLKYLSTFGNRSSFARDNTLADTLFKSDYTHTGEATCEGYSGDKLVRKTSRTEDIVVHFGTIASDNQVMRDRIVRDRLSSKLDGMLCFEMEAARLMNNFPCLVIRGISDYTNSYKNKR